MKFSASLKKNYEFRRLYTKGKSAASQYAVVYCRKNRLPANRLGMTTNRLVMPTNRVVMPTNRVGITVSTKIGPAVVRNRIRRRYREIYRLNEEKFEPGYDIVAVARTKCKDAPYRLLDADFMRLCRKLGICKQE